MRRREFVKLLGSAAATWPLAARAQQQGERMRRIGVLSNTAPEDPDNNARLQAFQQRLQQLGWTDGHNVRIDHRFAAANLENYRKYAAELVALAPDVIVALVVLCRTRSRPVGRYQSSFRSLPIRSAQASSKVCRARAAMPQVFCCSSTI